jgi:hypothetical protein
MNHKRMSLSAAPAPQDPRQGEHRREISDGDEHMAEVNMIFGGSMSITFKTQGKKLQREISLAQQIEPGRRMRWFDRNRPWSNAGEEYSTQPVQWILIL